MPRSRRHCARNSTTSRVKRATRPAPAANSAPDASFPANTGEEHMKKRVRTTEDVLKEQEAQANAGRKNVPATRGGTALTADCSNPWIEIGAELDKYLGAPLLKLTKQGEFAISETDTIPEGARCI